MCVKKKNVFEIPSLKYLIYFVRIVNSTEFSKLGSTTKTRIYKEYRLYN